MSYQPELGQAVFGQPWQPLECPHHLLMALECLSGLWYELTDNESPFSNSGAVFECPTFRVEAYSWSDEEQPFNFAWRDLRISWYKYLGRGTTCNRKVSAKEAVELVSECSSALLKEFNAT